MKQHVLERARSWSFSDQAAVDLPDLTLQNHNTLSQITIILPRCSKSKQDLSMHDDLWHSFCYTMWAVWKKAVSVSIYLMIAGLILQKSQRLLG